MAFRTRANVENINPVKLIGKECKKLKEKRTALMPISINSEIQQNLKRLKLCKNNKTDEQERNKKENDKVGKSDCEIMEVIKSQTNENFLKNNEQNYSLRSSLNQQFIGEKEYIKDIWNYMRQNETTILWPRSDYMRKQPHINLNMRSILIDWLIQVAEDNKMNAQSVHLSVHYIDRFLTKMSVTRNKLQLLGAAAMMIAGKIDEIYPPLCADWEYLTCNSYDGDQIKRMERLVLEVLDFNVQPPTALTFIRLLCTEHDFDNKTLYLSMYLAELMLLDSSDYWLHLPSELATAAVALARFTLAKQRPWTKQLSKFSGYSLKKLSPVVQRQQKAFVDSPTKSEQAVLEKYQSPKYKRVALLKPTVLKLEDFYDDDDEE